MEQNKITHASPQMLGMRPPQFNGKGVEPKRGPGRPKGSPNKMGHDLMTLVMQAAENVGFVEKNEKGEWVATGKGGTLKYLEWAAVNKSECFLALMARVAPKQVFADITRRSAKTVEEIEAELRDRGLPLDLLDHLMKAAGGAG